MLAEYIIAKENSTVDGTCLKNKATVGELNMKILSDFEIFLDANQNNTDFYVFRCPNISIPNYYVLNYPKKSLNLQNQSITLPNAYTIVCVKNTLTTAEIACIVAGSVLIFSFLMFCVIKQLVCNKRTVSFIFIEKNRNLNNF